MELRDKVADLVELKNQIKGYEEDIKALKEQVTVLEDEIEEDMLVSGTNKQSFPGLATVSLTIRSFPRIEDKDVFFEYLRKSEQEGLIQETVNTNTLSSWFKEKEFTEEQWKLIGLSNFQKPKLNLRSI